MKRPELIIAPAAILKISSVPSDFFRSTGLVPLVKSEAERYAPATMRNRETISAVLTA
jgi:hypothetical protein